MSNFLMISRMNDERFKGKEVNSYFETFKSAEQESSTGCQPEALKRRVGTHFVIEKTGSPVDPGSQTKQEPGILVNGFYFRVISQYIRTVYRLLMNAEGVFGLPQDVEWTMKEDTLYVLQSRPITTLSGEDGDDKRGWYLSLKRSFENLKSMRHTIEEELIPALQKETEDLAKTDLSLFSDQEIEDEVLRRRAIFKKWKKTYWDYFIPFAHGMRLFGSVYNDTVHPKDAYEFLTLLSTVDMVSLQRNNILQEMASAVRGSDQLYDALKKGDYTNIAFRSLLQHFISAHGDLLCRSRDCKEETPDLVNMIIEMASAPRHFRDSNKEIQEREDLFLSHFTGSRHEDAAEMLDIGRASYRMRDDDNIYMGRLKARVLEAEEELSHRSGTVLNGASSAGYFNSLSLDDHGSESVRLPETDRDGLRLQTRQITGQPAGPGIATGPAHVIQNASDLMNFRKGEVLVCDAIDPNMTFVVPLARAIVERRGGMLIHGAIIAREYGLPCVTGISRATDIIKSGDRITVDGYLGIVIIDVTSRSGSG